MKTNKFWSILMMLVLVLGTLVSFSSCGSDDDGPIITDPKEDPYDVTGTTWSDDHNFGDGVSAGTVITFTSSTARLQESKTVGQQTLTQTYNFTYKRSKNVIILTPKEEGIATLKATIDESGIEMKITNTSNGSEVAVVFKR